MAGIRLMPSGFGAVAPMPAPGAAEGRVIFVGEVGLTGKNVGPAARGSRPFAVCLERVGRR